MTHSDFTLSNRRRTIRYAEALPVMVRGQIVRTEARANGLAGIAIRFKHIRLLALAPSGPSL